MAVGVLYVGAGALHLVAPAPYLAVLPPWVPAPALAVALSGVAEGLGGLGVLSPWPRVRRWAGWGLAALLVAVYPANVHMAMAAERASWLLWGRLPLQGVLIAWALHASGALAARQSLAVSKAPGHARRARSTGYGA